MSSHLLFDHQNYDDLPSLEDIYQASKNLTLVGLFRDSVPLILGRYHDYVIGTDPAAFPALYELQSNYSQFHEMTWRSAEDLMKAEPRYGGQRPLYRQFMAEKFYASNGAVRTKDLCDLYYEDLYLSYWQDENIALLRPKRNGYRA